MMSVLRKLFIAALLCNAAALALALPADAQQGVKAGYLRCDVAGSVSFISFYHPYLNSAPT